MQNKPELFQFQDYREYLKHHFEYKKAQNAQWSYQAWAKNLGLSSNTSLIKIVKGQRQAGPKILESLVNYFQFKGDEKLYFENLVKMEKSSEDGEPHRSYGQSLRKKPGINDPIQLNSDEFSRLNHWWCFFIRSALKLKRKFKSAAEIRDLMRISASHSEIEDALNFLMKKGLISINSKGEYVGSNDNIILSEKMKKESFINYWDESLKMTNEVLHRGRPEELGFASVVFAVDKKDVPRAGKFLQEKLREFTKTFDVESGDQVYTLQVQLVPMSKEAKTQDDI